MSIKGFQGTSLLDFPGKIASLVFFGGCNLSCPYCHNPALVQTPQEYPDIPVEDLLALIEERRSFIDGVVISGGEPTLDPQLPKLLNQIKKMGLQTKLDTNGLRPDVLEQLLEQQLVDSIGMDIKTALPRYGELHPVPVDSEAVQHSLMLLKQTDIEVEFRTTCVPGFVEEEDIHAMGKVLQGAQLWVFQQFVAEPAMSELMQTCTPHAKEVLQQFTHIAEHYVEQTFIRGI